MPLTDEFFIAFVLLLAGFIQSVSGFGLGLVTMPLLTEVVNLKTATSLVALISVIANLTLILSYQSSLQFKAIFQLLLGSIVAIPMGIVLINNINNKIVFLVLGIVIVSYSIWTLFEWQLPRLDSPKFAYGFGFLSGFLAGAYNTGGPPVVIYGNACQWTPEEFKSNLNAFFLTNTLFVILVHFLQKHYTLEVGKLFLYGSPCLMIGLGIGHYFSEYINPKFFRQIILILLFVSGLKLILKSVYL